MIVVRKGERRLIQILCVVAALRVVVFAAAFPFFNNVDEQAHVDLVLKYSHGQPPRGTNPISAESAYYFALYGTPEYLNKPAQFVGQEFPQPLWLQPSQERDEQLRPLIADWEADTNFEAGEPPLYYAVAALFWKLGSLFGIHGGFLLYFLRFLNAGVMAALVWTGYRAAQLVFPERSFPRIAVPGLIAFFPQDTFYSAQSDVLSPILFGIALIGLLKLIGRERPKVSTGIYTGLSLAAACLSKTANIPLLIFAFSALAVKTLTLIRTGNFRRYGLTFAVLAACAIVPVAGWMAWNYHIFGDATGTAAKIQHLGWTRKPLSQWWPHSLFTLRGLHYFWSELMASFWRGELVWQSERLAGAEADAFYWISSALALAIVVPALLLRTTTTHLERAALWIALGSFVTALAFLVVLSIAYDFDGCSYPSRAQPYFTSGRLLGGATIPFLLLYAYALERITSWTKQKWPPFLLLGLIVAGITASELVVNWPVFASRYNFFHMCF